MAIAHFTVEAQCLAYPHAQQQLQPLLRIYCTNRFAQGVSNNPASCTVPLSRRKLRFVNNVSPHFRRLITYFQFSADG